MAQAWKKFLKKKQKSSTEGKDEEWKLEHRSPPVRTKDLNDGTVRVEMLIKGLEPGKDKFNPKNGTADLTFMNKGFGFNMETTLKNNETKTTTRWTFSVQKLPTKIINEESKWDVEKGKLVVIMTKDTHSKDINWESFVYERGLDQKSSSSSSDE